MSLLQPLSTCLTPHYHRCTAGSRSNSRAYMFHNATHVNRSRGVRSRSNTCNRISSRSDPEAHENQDGERLFGSTSKFQSLAGASVAAAVLATSVALPQPTLAIFNNGDQITDPQDALAALVATKRALVALEVDIQDMSANCPAPTFSCDMSQLLKKASGRVSGPLGRTLPTLIDELEFDPYTADDATQAVTQAEAMLKSNNARIKVDWTGPVDMLSLADSKLIELLEDTEPAQVKEAEDRVDACDETIDPREPGPFECRLVRALYAKSLAPGIN